jgi:acetyltransferase
VQDEGEAVAVATALAARRARPAAALGIGLITAQAGPGLIVADALGDTAALPELATATRERLAELLPPMTFQANPVDTGRPGETFTSVVAAVAGDPVIGILGVYAIAEAVVDLVSDVIESGVTAEIPTVIGIDGPADDVARVQRQGRALGIPVVQGPTNLARALAAIAEDARGARRPAVVANERDMDIGIEGCEEWDEARGKDLLGRLGISTPLRRRCADREAARRAVVELEGPLAVKLLDASVLHKTEMGGVILNVSSREEMEEALDRLESVGATEFLVESMAGPGIDLIVGARRDPVFGPIVALGLGGVAAEVIADVAIRVAPLSPEEASSMVDDLAGRALLLGHRGAASVDLAELGRIVSRIGDLVADDVVAEIEINPLRSTDGGIVALDAVVLPIYKDVKVLQ